MINNIIKNYIKILIKNPIEYEDLDKYINLHKKGKFNEILMYTASWINDDKILLYILENTKGNTKENKNILFKLLFNGKQKNALFLYNNNIQISYDLLNIAIKRLLLGNENKYGIEFLKDINEKNGYYKNLDQIKHLFHDKYYYLYKDKHCLNLTKYGDYINDILIKSYKEYDSWYRCKYLLLLHKRIKESNEDNLKNLVFSNKDLIFYTSKFL